MGCHYLHLTQRAGFSLQGRPSTRDPQPLLWTMTSSQNSKQQVSHMTWCRQVRSHITLLIFLLPSLQTPSRHNKLVCNFVMVWFLPGHELRLEKHVLGAGVASSKYLPCNLEALSLILGVSNILPACNPYYSVIWEFQCCHWLWFTASVHTHHNKNVWLQANTIATEVWALRPGVWSPQACVCTPLQSECACTPALKKDSVSHKNTCTRSIPKVWAP